jgi:hypothetical protein
MSPRIAIKSIDLSERRVPFRHPFRFGAVTVNEAPQIFVHVTIEVDGQRSTGAAAELMVPKWFNKDAGLSAGDTIDQLRQSAAIARTLYLEHTTPDTAFGLHAARNGTQVAACGKAGIPPLAANFGTAEIDKAILDALLRSQRTDFFNGMRTNLAGLDARLTPDLDNSAISNFLTGRKVTQRIAVRYTIGMLDTLDSVREAIRAKYRFFKIKLCGDPEMDRVRLSELAALLGDSAYQVTLDANEQYRSIGDLDTLVKALQTDTALGALAARLLYIEQPFAREDTWNFDLRSLATRVAFIIDEADDSYDAFPRAKILGYRGVSSKSCKGLYKSLLNGARAARWNKAGGAFFISAEDLTCQAGLAVQQDNALVAFHGLKHAERNGHHYVDGFANTPAREAESFLAAHSDLYEKSGGIVRLAVHDGTVATESLAVPGFAYALEPGDIGPHNEKHDIKEHVT